MYKYYCKNNIDYAVYAAKYDYVNAMYCVWLYIFANYPKSNGFKYQVDRIHREKLKRFLLRL